MGRFQGGIDLMENTGVYAFGHARNKQMSDTLLVGCILAFAGGFLDVYTYICRGGVFAFAQTVNVIQMGARILQGDFGGILIYLIPVTAFILGILCAEILKKQLISCKRIHWRQIIIIIELLIILPVSFIPAGDFNAGVIILISFVCALQFQSFRTTNGKQMVTTMVTGDLRSAVENAYKYTTTKEKEYIRAALLYFMIILLFLTGVMFGYVFTTRFMEKSALIVSLGLFITFLLLFRKNPA
jgi:uncharacterized membrane protein YoaK (UPF0700 family)